MERVIFVEVLDRRGEVQRRERIASLPLRIGRSYDNDLILEDPHVSEAHALLERSEDGDLVLHDLDSLNGLLEHPGRARLRRARVVSGTSVQLGRTVLRFRDASHPTPAALRLRSLPPWSEWLFTRPSAALAWLTLFVGLSLIDTVRSATEEIDWAAQATALGGQVLLAGFWAGAWALVGRLLGQRPRSATHFAIAICALLAGMLQQALFEVGQFLFAPVEPLRVIEMLADGVIFGAVVLAHLSVLQVGRSLRRRLVAGAAGAIVTVFQVVGLRTGEIDWIAVLPYWSRIEPIGTEWLPVSSSDAFFREVRGLELELGELRKASLEEEEP